MSSDVIDLRARRAQCAARTETAIDSVEHATEHDAEQVCALVDDAAAHAVPAIAATERALDALAAAARNPYAPQTLTLPYVLQIVEAQIARQPELVDIARLSGLTDGELRAAVAHELFGERLNEISMQQIARADRAEPQKVEAMRCSSERSQPRPLVLSRRLRKRARATR